MGPVCRAFFKVLLGHVLCSEKLFRITALALSIAALFVTAQVLSPRSSVSIEVRPIGGETEGLFPIHYEDIAGFYETRNIEIPPAVGSLLMQRHREDSFQDFYNYTLLLERAVSNKSSNFSPATQVMEAELFKGSRRALIRSHLGSWESVDFLWDQVQSIKKDLSPGEFYIFLCALSYAKVFSNLVQVRNSGELDLKDLTVRIPFPPTDWEASQRLQFRDWDVMSVNVLHAVDSDNGSLKWFLPSLRKGQSFDLTVWSRSLPIDRQDVLVNYAENRQLPSPRRILTLVVVLFLVIVVGFALLDYFGNLFLRKK